MSWDSIIGSSQAWLAQTFLLATRLAGLLLTTPPVGAQAIPAIVRVAFVFALAALLAAALPGQEAVGVSNVADFVTSALIEFALGATMALGIAFAFAAFSVGARLLDVQIGFGIGQVFDPVTRQQVPLLSGAMGQLALVLFFVSDTHLTVFRGVALSVERFPPGHAWPLGAAAGPLLQQASGMFTLGFAMVAPVVFCLALIDLGLGVLARNLPQMNMFVLGVPVKVAAGLAALALWLTASGGLIARINASILSGWEAVFR
jgi:flagellar biosynthetic protein FliR